MSAMTETRIGPDLREIPIEEDNFWYDDLPEDDDPEKEWVLDCGLEGCCMPGYHFRSECHTPEMIEAYAAECGAHDSARGEHG